MNSGFSPQMSAYDFSWEFSLATHSDVRDCLLPMIARPVQIPRFNPCPPPCPAARPLVARLRVAGRSALVAGVLAWWTGVGVAATTNSYFGIHVLDDRSGRGVPLVELETVNHLRYVTDSGGWVAFAEPGLMGQPVYFLVRSHGYEFPKDGLGNAGVALTPVAGGRAEVRLKRLNLAERLCRLTGEGLYRDSVLLGEPTPLAEPLGTGLVAGQDSVLAVPYRGRLSWFWGDTLRMSYPLGHFGTAGAVSELPGRGGLAPQDGVNYRYFTNRQGFSRPVCALGTTNGVVWIDGVLTVADDTGRERLLAHYTHLASLGKTLDHGLAIFNDTKGEFERLQTLALTERWRFPHGHPLRWGAGQEDYFYFGDVFPNVRVPARLADVVRPSSYEAWTCVTVPSGGAPARVRRGVDGALDYAWSATNAPFGIADEERLLREGQIKAGEQRLHPVDVATGRAIELHRGSVNWNEYRQRWVILAGQRGGTSFLGEIWYAEARALTGPWRTAIKVASHRNYSFYNPVQHPFFDEAGGRVIYFEGTYTATFADHPEPTPRYDYNQILYRLDLDHARLKPAQD